MFTRKFKNLFLDKTSAVTLVLCLLASFSLTLWSAIYISKKHKNELQTLTKQIASSISIRMSRYESSLIQLRAHLITTSDLDRENFRIYVENTPLIKNYPGIQGLGYTVKIPKNDLNRYITSVRKEGFPDFTVWPEYPRETYFSIHFLEPFDWRNKRAFGFDMSTDVTRLEVMDLARDTAQAVATNKVILVQETNKDPQAGFLVYLPVYKGIQTPKSIDERINNLKGFIFAPFRAGDLFRFVLGTQTSIMNRVKVEVFDGYEVTNDKLYFQNSMFYSGSSASTDELSLKLPLKMLGQVWTIRTQLYMNRELVIEKAFPYAVAFVCLLISSLIFWIVFSTRKYNRELSSAIATRDEFMSLASHELKTPLTSLSLQTQMIKRSLKKEGSSYDIKSIEKFTDTTITQVNRLSRLVDDLLDISRIKSGKFKLQIERFEFCTLVRDVMERTLPLFARDDIHPPELEVCSEVMVEWDKLRIEQVVINLLTNALRYGRGRPIYLKVEKSESNVLFSIRDQGIGIDKANLEKVFNRFQRFDDASSSAGLGLGLYLCYNIVMAHDGKIWVESEIGSGSTFFVQLPFSIPGDFHV